jgi:hypothetical protein
MQAACDIGIGTHGGKLVMPSDYPVMIEPASEEISFVPSSTVVNPESCLLTS